MSKKVKVLADIATVELHDPSNSVILQFKEPVTSIWLSADGAASLARVLLQRAMLLDPRVEGCTVIQPGDWEGATGESLPSGSDGIAVFVIPRIAEASKSHD